MPIHDPDRTLEDVLDAVDEFGTASFGLVAWELLTSEESITAIWRQAVEQLMLRATGAIDLDEPTYRLTLAGRGRLRELRLRSALRQSTTAATTESAIRRRRHTHHKYKAGS